MSKIVWADPDDSEAGGALWDYAQNIYCDWEADYSKQKLIVTLPLQGKTKKVSLMPYGIDEMSEASRKNLLSRLAKGVSDNFYSVSQLHDDLDRIPTESEVSRLIESYPSFYEKPYRKGFLYQLLAGNTHVEMAASKMEYVGEDSTSKGYKGKAAAWTKSKAKKMALRLLYLQFVEDDEMSRGDAVIELMESYTHLTKATSLSNIYKATRRPCDK